LADEDLSKLRIEKTEKPTRPRRRKLLRYAVALAVMLAVAIILFITGVFSPAFNVQVLTVSKIYPSQTITALTASGYVTAERKAAVASKVTGRLVALFVEEGSKIKKGQVIARLESEDVEAARSQAQANLNVARYNLEQASADESDAALQFKRNQELIKKGYIARSEYDTSEARYLKSRAAVQSARAAVKSAQAALNAAGINVEYTMIRAPFDAVVLTKNADIGDIVTPISAAATAKAAVVTIADMDSLQVEADVSESNLGLVKIGQPCEVQLDALPDSRFAAAVHMIVPTADRSKATVMVKVRFVEKDPRILPDMSAKVAFLSRKLTPEERNPRTAVPKTAVQNRNNQQSVFTVNDGKAALVHVTTGEALGDMVEVTSGVKPGDKIIVTPPRRLKSGDRVKIPEK
jgi:RND family efflux transporter MFP subunit